MEEYLLTFNLIAYVAEWVVFEVLHCRVLVLKLAEDCLYHLDAACFAQRGKPECIGLFLYLEYNE